MFESSTHIDFMIYSTLKTFWSTSITNKFLHLETSGIPTKFDSQISLQILLIKCVNFMVLNMTHIFGETYLRQIG